MNLKLLFLLAVIALSPLASFAQQDENYIGYQHKGVVYGATLPNGVRDMGGGLLSDENYGVTRFHKKNEVMLWLERVVHIEKDGVPRWEVLDVLNFGKSVRNRQLLFSYASPCTLNGEENLELIVEAKLNAKNKKIEVLNAWQVDLGREVFAQVTTEGIDCKYSKSKSRAK